MLDLGCAAGDLAAELESRGARVIGMDNNPELLQQAQARNLVTAEFRLHDLRDIPPSGEKADGIWCSFTAAYFPDFLPVLESWARLVKPGGWLALVEVDDLFGHEPLPARQKALLEAYIQESLEARRYDYRMGGKLSDFLARAGWKVSGEFQVPDAELAFDGPATPEVLRAWGERLDRLISLRKFCGDDFEELRGEFMNCLASSRHLSRARVCCRLAHLRYSQR